jgi:SNF2 family DNA or RNA helicase
LLRTPPHFSYIDSGVFGSGVSYLRLDGTISAADRQPIADRFNADISIDLLLLTTQIGGVGLTLTGADVVIFVDHDFNPTYKAKSQAKVFPKHTFLI